MIDEQIERARYDIEYFADNFFTIRTGWEGWRESQSLYNWQRDCLHNWNIYPQNNTIKSRRIGGSTIEMIFAFHQALFNENATVLVVSNAECQIDHMLTMGFNQYTPYTNNQSLEVWCPSRKLSFLDGQYLTEPGNVPAIPEPPIHLALQATKSRTRISFSNGSCIIGVTANMLKKMLKQDRRLFETIIAIIIDEPAFIPDCDKLIDSLNSITNKFILCGTPFDKNDIHHALKKYHQWNTRLFNFRVVPEFNDEKWVNDMKTVIVGTKEYQDMVFKREFECEA